MGLYLQPLSGPKLDIPPLTASKTILRTLMSSLVTLVHLPFFDYAPPGLS